MPLETHEQDPHTHTHTPRQYIRQAGYRKLMNQDLNLVKHNLNSNERTLLLTLTIM